MAERYLGLDYGTGGCKGCLIDREGNVLAYAYREYPILANSEGWSEHPVEHYWRATCEIIAECKRKAGVSASDIRCVGTSAALPSLVMLDEEGRPLHNAYNLMDRRANRQEEWLKQTIGVEEIFNLTGNRVEDHPVLVNLLWEKENRPESFRRLRQALTIDGYVRFLLTGRYTAHISAGIFYGVAYDVRNARFDQTMLDRIGLPREILPELFRCEEIIGTVTEQAAAECGLRPGTAVAAGQVDCNAGWIGGGAIEPGDVQMNLGTCGNIGVVRRGGAYLSEMFNFPYTSDCTRDYVTVSTTQTGGQTLRYLKETLGQPETAMATLIPSLDAYDLLNMEAEHVPPGSEGLLVLPYLLGERTPLWDNDARGVIFGQRFVKEQHARLHDQRARQRDALLLPAGELVGHAAVHALHLYELEDLVHAALDLRLGRLAQPEPVRHVIKHVVVRKQRVALEYHRRIALVGREGVDGLVAQIDFALVGALKARDHAQRRGLAAAGGT